MGLFDFLSGAATHNKKVQQAREDWIRANFEESIEPIILMIGNASRHHANLPNADKFKYSSFTEKRFINFFALNVFAQAVSIGQMDYEGISNERDEKEIMTHIERLVHEMAGESRQAGFRNVEVECFMYGLEVAMEHGIEAGRRLSAQGFFVLPK